MHRSDLHSNPSRGAAAAVTSARLPPADAPATWTAPTRGSADRNFNAAAQSSAAAGCACSGARRYLWGTISAARSLPKFGMPSSRRTRQDFRSVGVLDGRPRELRAREGREPADVGAVHVARLAKRKPAAVDPEHHGRRRRLLGPPRQVEEHLGAGLESSPKVRRATRRGARDEARRNTRATAQGRLARATHVASRSAHATHTLRTWHLEDKVKRAARAPRRPRA